MLSSFPAVLTNKYVLCKYLFILGTNKSPLVKSGSPVLQVPFCKKKKKLPDMI